MNLVKKKCLIGFGILIICIPVIIYWFYLSPEAQQMFENQARDDAFQQMIVKFVNKELPEYKSYVFFHSGEPNTVVIARKDCFMDFGSIIADIHTVHYTMNRGAVYISIYPSRWNGGIDEAKQFFDKLSIFIGDKVDVRVNPYA